MIRTTLPRVCVVLCVLSGTMLSLRAADKPVSNQPNELKPTLKYRYGGSIPRTEHNTSPNDNFILTMRLEGVPPELNMTTFTDMVRNTPEELFSSKVIRDRLLSNKHILFIRRMTESGRPGGGMMRPGMRGPGMPGRMRPKRGNASTRRPARSAAKTTKYEKQKMDFTGICEISFFAENVAQGKEMTQGVIAVLNFWWQNNGREYLATEIKACEKSRAKLTLSFVKAVEQQEKDKNLLAGVGHPDKKTITELKTKLLFLDIDLVGTRARIASIQKLAEVPNKEKITSSAQKQIELIKIKAHIDLAGLLAQRERLFSIQKSYASMFASSHKNSQLQSEIRQSSYRLMKLQAASDLKELQPVRVINDITIQPIDWKGRKK